MIYVDSDNLVWLLGLIDNYPVPPAYVTTATVTATVTTADGTVVGSPVTLAYVAGSVTLNLPNNQSFTSSAGNYRGQFPYTTSLVDGTTYYVKVVAVVGGNQRVFRGQFTAGYSTN